MGIFNPPAHLESRDGVTRSFGLLCPKPSSAPDTLGHSGRHVGRTGGHLSGLEGGVTHLPRGPQHPERRPAVSGVLLTRRSRR